MPSIHSILIFGFLLLGSFAEDFNCKVKPLFPKEAMKCCQKPENTFDFTSYINNCSEFAKSNKEGRSRRVGWGSGDGGGWGRRGGRSGNGKYNGGKVNACLSECVLNQTGVLEYGEFNIQNVYTLLSQNIPDQTVVSVVFVGFQKCIPEIKAKLESFQNSVQSKNSNNGQLCSMYPLLVVMCTMKESFLNCPTSLWTDSTSCNSSRDYVKNCPPQPMG